MVGRINGGGGVVTAAWAYIAVTYPSGSTCTATNGTTTLTAQGTSGLYVFQIPEPTTTPETWTVSCTDGTKTKSATAEISAQYSSVAVTLVYGRLPVGYQEVEYIASTANGLQYIDTGISAVFGNEYEYDIKFMLLDSSTRFVGGCYNIGSTSMNLWLNFTGCGNGGDNYMQFHYCQAQIPTNVTSQTPKTDPNILYELQLMTATQEHFLNGTRLGSNNVSYRDVGLKPFLFCMNVSGTAGYHGASRIYSYKRFNNSTNEVYQELVPCYRTQDNVAGMYDLVSGSFLTNAGSGTFVVGPDV